jgi:hypothetical protein
MGQVPHQPGKAKQDNQGDHTADDRPAAIRSCMGRGNCAVLRRVDLRIHYFSSHAGWVRAIIAEKRWNKQIRLLRKGDGEPTLSMYGVIDRTYVMETLWLCSISNRSPPILRVASIA